MVDPAVLAIGFGLMPLAALLLYPLRPWLLAHEDLLWGVLVGTIAFVGIAHASTDILTAMPFLRLEIGTDAAAGLLALGVVAGMGVGHALLNRPRATPPSAMAWLAAAGAAYLVAHSLSDGLVLGAAYAGPFPLGWPVDALDTFGSLVHRFAEGALVMAPALVLAWKVPKAGTLLLAGLATVPAVYVTMALGSGPGTSSAIAFASVSVLLSAFEAGLALLLLGAGYVPLLARTTDRRWPLAAGAAFLALFLVHLVVE